MIKSYNDENLKKYFSDLGGESCAPISREEERELFNKIKNGCQISKNRIIECNLRFVVRVASNYSKHYGLPLNDLISEGNIGLIYAIDKFDNTMDIKFITYAVWWIKRYIKLYIDGVVFDNIVENDLVNDVFYDGDENELSNITDFDKIIDCEYLSKEDDENKRVVIDKLLSLLNNREEMIVRYYYGLGEMEATNLDEIGEILNLTKERVRQIKKVAISKLKSSVLLLDEFNTIYND